MTTQERFDLTRKCRNCIHLKWVHSDPEVHNLTCGHFVYENNLEYLEQLYDKNNGFLKKLLRYLRGEK